MKRSVSATTLALALSLTGCGASAPSVACPVCPSAPTEAAHAEASPPIESPSSVPTQDDGVVRLEGTPEVSPELHARLQQYLETRSATLQQLSDDGTSMLITTRFANTSQLHLIEAPMGARRQLTFSEEPVFGAAFYPSDDNAILIQQDVGGAENYQLYRFDRRSGRSTRITNGTSRNPEFLFNRDGSRLAYVSNARNGADMDIWMSDGTTAGELFLERQGDWHLLEFSRDGRKLLLQEFVSILDQRIYVVDVATREVTRLSPEASGADRTAVFSADGQSVYLVSDRLGDFAQLYEVQLAHIESTAWRALTAAVPWNVEELALSGDGRNLAFAINEDGISTLRVLDTRSRRITAISGAPRGVVTGLRAASNANTFAFSMTASQLSGDVFSVDLRTRAITRWTESEMGGIDPSTFIEPELVHYTSFDGRTIPAFYYRPRAGSEGSDERFPLVVSIHGGPESQARPWFSPLVQYLASEARIAVLVPNVRGSDGYGKAYLALDDGRLREDSVRDIGALLDFAATRPEIDSTRVGVYGGSYGGYMVLASLVHYGARIRAGVDIVGIANFVTFLEATAPYRRELRRVEYGDESDPEMRSFLSGISPVTHVDQIQSALFVAHGSNDPRVPVAEAEQIVHAVRNQGHEAWYMLARNEGHGFIRKANRDRFTELSVMFLEQNLRR